MTQANTEAGAKRKSKAKPKPTGGDSLSRDDWVKAARAGLIEGGLHEVKVDRLCRTLGVTKGSFYWHFDDHQPCSTLC